MAGLPKALSWWNARSSAFVMVFISSELSFVSCNRVGYKCFSEVRNQRCERSHTSVPSKMGLFMNAHTAKWVRSSWIVKLPLPISIISISLCAKKLTEDKWPTFSLIIDFMKFQVGLVLVPSYRRLDQSLQRMLRTSNLLTCARNDPR